MRDVSIQHWGPDFGKNLEDLSAFPFQTMLVNFWADRLGCRLLGCSAEEGASRILQFVQSLVALMHEVVKHSSPSRNILETSA